MIALSIYNLDGRLIMKSVAQIILLVFVMIIGCSCHQYSNVIGNGTDETEIIYKRGEIEIVEFLDEAEIYTGAYTDNISSSTLSVSQKKNTVVYGLTKFVFGTDENPSILSLCLDPVCDHTKEHSCILSYGLVRDVMITEYDIYFLSTTGIYRYSKETLTTEPYAIFNTYIINQFLMGRYLYAQVGYDYYIKIDLLTNKAMAIPIETVEYVMIYPYDGMLYCMDSSSNIYQCDENFENACLIAANRHPDCFIQMSYQVYGDRVYYLAVGDSENTNLYSYDLLVKETALILKDIYCFGIAADKLYVQLYNPIEGPLYRNQQNDIINVTAYTGNSIYCASLDNPEQLSLVTKYEEENCRLDGYYLVPTEQYLYVSVSDYTNMELKVCVYRYDVVNHEWQYMANMG